MKKPPSIILLSISVLVATAQPAAPPPASLARLPLTQEGGTWPTSHVQGVGYDPGR
ncbi:MAG: hypothetical protein H7343_06760 [Undibacterium sp.]|nr:hypothetical protein [Opitutaceae bacterium]